jgi:hypothetical protein
VIPLGIEGQQVGLQCVLAMAADPDAVAKVRKPHDLIVTPSTCIPPVLHDDASLHTFCNLHHIRRRCR